jgi:hypothetical protein
MTSLAFDNTKAAALHYSKEFGMCIIILKTDPVGNERKMPAVDWKLYQILRSPIQIDRWFAKKPDHNIAAVMGSVCQMVAFDVDGDNAVDWIRSRLPLMSLKLQDAIANTFKTRTGSGGEHSIFEIDGDISDVSQKIVWTDGKKNSQILLQGNGHYVVVAPSQHPNDNLYEWNGKPPQTITREQFENEEKKAKMGKEKEEEEFIAALTEEKQQHQQVQQQQLLQQYVMMARKKRSVL